MDNMLETPAERLKLGLAILALGVLFWGSFIQPSSSFSPLIQRYFQSGATREKKVLGAFNLESDLLLIQAIRANSDLSALLIAGKKFLSENKPELAIETFKQAIKSTPNYRDSYYLLAYAYLKLYQQSGDGYYPFRPGDAFSGHTRLELAYLSLLKARRLDPFSEKVKLLLGQVKELMRQSG